MRKLFILLISVLFLGSFMSAYAFNFCFWKKNKTVQSVKVEDFEILPTMDTVSIAKNQVWVGTFQLIWNDLINEIIKHPVEYTTGKSDMAKALNKMDFKSSDLNESSFYKKLGLASPKLKKEIEKAIKDKFNEKSDILDKFDWTPAEQKYILYAMLKKDFEYIEVFEKLDDDKFNGSNGMVKYFGVKKDSLVRVKNSVGVLFYNNEKDYAIRLLSKQGDNVYLYRTNDSKTLDKLYSDMITKSKNYKGKKYLAKKDEFKAPFIEFKKERDFSELCNKPIKNSQFMISKALETVQFKMTETGVKLKSEAGMMVGLTCAPGYVEKPRYFYFNDKYVIFLQEKDKPYFAMKIEDAKALQ